MPYSWYVVVVVRERSARPLIRLIVGLASTGASYFIHPALAVAIGCIALVWILLGLSAVIHDAATAPETTTAPVVPPRASKPRTAEIECPKCSLFVPTDAAACTCGWVVPDAA